MMERTNDRIQILLLAKIFEPLLRNSPHEDGDFSQFATDENRKCCHKICKRSNYGLHKTTDTIKCISLPDESSPWWTSVELCDLEVGNR